MVGKYAWKNLVRLSTFCAGGASVTCDSTAALAEKFPQARAVCVCVCVSIYIYTLFCFGAHIYIRYFALEPLFEPLGAFLSLLSS